MVEHEVECPRLENINGPGPGDSSRAVAAARLRWYTFNRGVNILLWSVKSANFFKPPLMNLSPVQSDSHHLMQFFFNLWRRSFSVCVGVTSVTMDPHQRHLGASCPWWGCLFGAVFVCDHGDKALRSNVHSCGLEFGKTEHKSIAIMLNKKFLKVCKGILIRNLEQPEWWAVLKSGFLFWLSWWCVSCTVPEVLAAISCRGRSSFSWENWRNTPKVQRVSGTCARFPPAQTSADCTWCAHWPAHPWRGRRAWRRRPSAGCRGWGSYPAERPSTCDGRPPPLGDPSRSRSAQAWTRCLWWRRSPPGRRRWGGGSGKGRRWQLT